MIVNVIEPDHGTVFDPACGSGGMFVQSSHFIEDEGLDTARRVSFFGQEKNRDTIRIAKMNLAVHGLDGKIAEAMQRNVLAIWRGRRVPNWLSWSTASCWNWIQTPWRRQVPQQLICRRTNRGARRD